MLKPPPLKPGSTLGIISPSFWLKKEDLDRTISLFKTKGYKIKLGQAVQAKEGPFAGSPAERVSDIHDMFLDPEVDAIFCARGGYGANRVLPLLDFDLIKSHPKIFMGYSDITALLMSITQQTGLVTFHGPMLVTFKEGMIDYNFDLMEDILGGQFQNIIQPPGDLPVNILKPGIGQGPLWGGNLTLIINRLGTDKQLNTKGSILFLEDIGEYLYSFDRMLYHLREAGIFDTIQGLIFGELVDMKDQKTSFGKSTDEIILDICGDLDIPILSNFPCGHGKYQATLPLSIPVQLQAEINQVSLTLLESPVS